MINIVLDLVVNILEDIYPVLSIKQLNTYKLHKILFCWHCLFLWIHPFIFELISGLSVGISWNKQCHDIIIKNDIMITIQTAGGLRK